MKYFGTDGIRMQAEEFTPEVIEAVVRGLVRYAGDEVKVLIGGDTRESTEWILAELERALESYGLEYGNVGVLPTPAIDFCFLPMGFDLAIDVTASHNPYTDNGIKIFERGERTVVAPDNGEAGAVESVESVKWPRKLGEEGQRAVEQALAETHESVGGPEVATTLREDLHEDALGRYEEHLLEYAKAGDGSDFGRLKIAMDCANGAMSVIKDKIFRELGAEVEVINAEASYGTQINDNCGSTHLEKLAALVREKGLDFGVAFDGDGDRCLMVDETGAEVDGDQILAILADYLGAKSMAVTVMANQGLMNWLKERGLKSEITAVGDSEVLAAMEREGLELGGEQSGHIILPGEPTGDGMLTALMVAKAVVASGKKLSELAGVVAKLPQVMVNFEADEKQKAALKTSAEAKKLLLEYASPLEQKSGRLLVRPSGTENLIRVTIWGENAEEITQMTNELAYKLGEILAKN